MIGLELKAAADAEKRHQKRLDALIRIEETCMLYALDPYQGMEIIREIVDRAIDGDR